MDALLSPEQIQILLGPHAAQGRGERLDPTTRDGGDVIALIERLDKLVGVMALKKAPELWTAKDIAAWMGLSESTVALKVVSRPGFPSPVVPTGSSEAKRRWFGDEVIEWARMNRGRLPKGRRS
ncbi:hypothetical protein PHO31112_05379 [Pandoraea horticolens]|uniref:Uncharacterized protein n=1 Tax=Pandoraea horticolens TaxID=2508298 RepID=A0A5E4ZE24_9BURK|nr:hypothetical protein [Pandoraea horticolens]VVE58782.1 hypothetical protein PHO31112_05379 [Pandoraea horticolens]